MNSLNHYEYTELAVEIYQQYTKNKIKSKIFGSNLSQGSLDEDKFNPFVLNFQRILNWHFFNNKNSISNTRFPGIRTSEKRVDRLIEKVIRSKTKYKEATTDEEKEDDLERLLDVTGRLIHHIQDMSTFSHVVPVYHGITPKDSYEVFGKKMIDKISLELGNETSENSLCIMISPTEIKANNDEYKGLDKAYFFNIYQVAAKKTLRVLNSDKHAFDLFINGEKGQLKWNGFWKEKSNTEVAECTSIENRYDDFGSFGKLCNNFGNPFFKANDNLYEVNHVEYMKIYKFLMKKSILDTITIIEKVFSDLKV